MRTKEGKLNIVVAGTGYVGISIATLLAQHHHVTAVDIIEDKVNLINSKKSPIQDEYIEKYLAEKELDLTATLNAEAACKASVRTIFLILVHGFILFFRQSLRC